MKLCNIVLVHSSFKSNSLTNAVISKYDKTDLYSYDVLSNIEITTLHVININMYESLVKDLNTLYIFQITTCPSSFETNSYRQDINKITIIEDTITKSCC